MRDFQIFGRYLSLDADDQSGAGEGMADEQVFRDADIAPDAARGILDLGLERREFRHGKTKLHIVMDFYLRHARAGRMSVPAFAHVGVERTLCDEVRPEFLYLLLQHFLIHTAHREALFAHRSLAFE